MRIIKIGDCRISVGFCNLRCPYCVHLGEETENISPEKIAESLENCRSVYIGGAEPTVHGDLIELLEILHGKNIEITLKTDGLLPEKIRDTLPFVHRYVFEIKGDFEDLNSLAYLSGLSLERAKKYAENLLKSIRIAKENGKAIRIWFRVIPGFIDRERFRKMMEKIGRVDEILLYQFLSRPDWDKPVVGLEKPDFSLIRDLENAAKEYADKVIVIGEDEK